MKMIVQIKLSIMLVLLVVLTIAIYSIVSDTTSAIIQSNNTIASDSINMTSHSDGRQIIVTWLTSNETKPDFTPMISISTEDFWNTFEPLLEQSNQ